MIANGYAAARKKSDKAKPQHFEARRPLELTQMDILEFFVNKAKVYIILLLDDFSRFILGWRLLEQTSVDAVIGVVADDVDRYGKKGLRRIPTSRRCAIGPVSPERSATNRRSACSIRPRMLKKNCAGTLNDLTPNMKSSRKITMMFAGKTKAERLPGYWAFR
jgi:transposase InsO family protein